MLFECSYVDGMEGVWTAVLTYLRSMLWSQSLSGLAEHLVLFVEVANSCLAGKNLRVVCPINHHTHLKTAHTLPRPPHHLHTIRRRRSFYIASPLLNQTSALLP